MKLKYREESHWKQNAIANTDIKLNHEMREAWKWRHVSMWYGWNTHPVTDSETFLSKGWLSRSVLGACVCASMWQQTSPSTPHPHSLSPPSLARSLFTSTSAVPHFSLCRHGKHAYFLLFCLLALLQHPSVPLVCSPPPPAYVSPPPMGFVGQPGYLTIPAAVKGVERSDTTLLPWCRSASLLLYAFRLTLCFAG